MSDEKKKNHWNQLASEIGAEIPDEPEVSEDAEVEAEANDVDLNDVALDVADQQSVTENVESVQAEIIDSDSEGDSDSADDSAESDSEQQSDEPSSAWDDSPIESSTEKDDANDSSEDDSAEDKSADDSFNPFAQAADTHFGESGSDSDDSQSIISSDEAIKKLQIKLFGDIHEGSDSLATSAGDSWSELTNELGVDPTFFEEPSGSGDGEFSDESQSEVQDQSDVAEDHPSKHQESEDNLSQISDADSLDEETDEEQVEKSTTPKKRKRRRRRRGRGSRDEKSSTSEEGSSTGESTTDDSLQQNEITSSEEDTTEKSGDDDSSGKKTGRKRRRRGRGRGKRSEESKEKSDRDSKSDSQTDPDLLDDDSYQGYDQADEDHEDESSSTSGKSSGSVSHRNLPSWEDAVGVLISGNIASRDKTQKKPSKQSGNSRGRKRRKKGRGKS